MSATDEPQSLRALHEAADAKRQTLESNPDATSPAFASDLDDCIALYTRLIEQISSVSLFSPNETLEDIATSSLPYLLVHYRLGDLISRIPARDPGARKEVVGRSRGAYESFLSVVDGYGLLLGTHSAKQLERYRDEGERFEVVAAGKDATARRNGKIEAFRAEKQLRERLEFLKREPGYVEQGGDEELVRDAYLAEIALAVHRTFQALDGLNREMEILALAPSHPVPSPTAPAANPEDVFTARLDAPLRPRGTLANPSGPLLSQKGKPLQPFTLIGSRAELARGVFRPGHNLPTMSIDEYLEEEKRRGGIIEGGGEESGRKPAVDEDDMENADRETYKAREWDEFKDHNRQGAGNTMNMG
ncbi:hypothetical protein NLU13_0601 [Sarocladium strictum]|uniref:TAP42-like protein n=1 Tax=Sarocladium strictum TaxID=5046 RepID=A0AA39LBN4_SARSR|nr:hypothetical protein NLU13_0601 [Sarocladium strictum]